MSEQTADAFKASLAPGEISIQFGRIEARGPADGAVTVALTRSVAMSPRTALRLLSRLRESLRESELRSRVSPQDVASTMGTTPVNAQPDAAGQLAARLFRLVDGLGVSYLHERSFRMAHETLLANRVLLSVPADRLGPDAAARVAAIGEALGLPDGLRGEVPAQVAAARCVHFGFEADPDRALYKIYFERRDAAAEAARAAPGAPVLLHIAYKWDLRDPSRHVVTRYHWYPVLSAKEIRSRMTQIYGTTTGEALAAAHAMLDLACSRIAAEKLQFIEVREDGNDRLSFDLNVYDAGLTLKDVQPQLAQLRRHFGLRPGQFQALYDQVHARPFGHFAGGVHRDGRAFVTIYYGVRSRG